MASTYLTKANPTANTDSRKKGTIAFWFKRSKLGATQYLYTEASDGNNAGVFYLAGGDTLNIISYDGGSSQTQLSTNRLFRDTNGWYHLVFAYDSTLGTADDRQKLWINGVQETSFSTRTNPSQNGNFWFGVGGNNYPIRIGRSHNAGDYFDGLMSHFHRVDSQALAPTIFGEVDSSTGEWKIKTNPSITYTGTSDFNFFILKDGNSVTDQSGEGNNLTVGSGTLTNMKDCPSNVFATFNNLEYYGSDGATLSNTNTTYASPSAGHRYLRSTIGVSTGKYYAEFKLAVSSGSGTNTVGITDHEMNDGTDELSQDIYSYAYVDDGSVRANGSNVDTGEATYAANDIVMVAMDITNSKLYFGKNGTWINSGDPTSGSTGTGAYSIQPVASTLTGCYHFAAGDWVNPGTNTWSANFGNGFFGTTAVASAGTNASNNGVFEYDVPAGYTALSTKGLNK